MENNISLRFSAIDPIVKSNIPEPTEKDYGDNRYVYWGIDNAYPQFLFDLSQNCAILGSIIQGVIDYVKGNSVSSTVMTQEEAEDLIEKTVSDYAIFGVFYWQIIRNLGGKVQKINWLDARYVRSDKDNNVFYYSENFGKRYGRTNNALVYNRYNPDRLDPESIICVKSPMSRGVYGTPLWSGAIKDAVIQTKIETFHVSELENNFAGSAVISFNNGQPTSEQKKEIEKMVSEKFAGAENAARFLLIYNDSKDNAASVERLTTDDLPDRYENLAKRTREQLFISWRATPSLFGLATADNAFNNEEYEQAFRLFSKTVIRPIQTKITSTLAKLFNGNDVMTIEPFSLEVRTDENVQ